MLPYIDFNDDAVLEQLRSMPQHAVMFAHLDYEMTVCGWFSRFSSIWEFVHTDDPTGLREFFDEGRNYCAVFYDDPLHQPNWLPSGVDDIKKDDNWTWFWGDYCYSVEDMSDEAWKSLRQDILHATEMYRLGGTHLRWE